ncbi:MAG: lipoprotein insertase outer membrane protein LolB [Lysobacteraceae bacterium]
MNARVARVALAALLLAGCATRGPLSSPPPAIGLTEGAVYATQSAREAGPASDAVWRLQGRVAFANGQDAATLRLDWVQRGARYRIPPSAPVIGRTLALGGGPGGARLAGLDGGPREAADAEALLREATGWSLPVAQFPRWVRGLRGPGPSAGLALDAEGRPLGWTQAGWLVDYRDWFPGDPALPRRLFARRDGVSVRLVIETWAAPGSDAAP